MKLFLILCCAAAICLIPACGDSKSPSAEYDADGVESMLVKAQHDGFANPAAATESNAEILIPGTMLVAQNNRAFASRGPAQGGAQKIQRQIIQTASINLVVDEFAGVPAKVASLVTKYNGFVANSNMQGSSGSPRSGQWTIRIPVFEYDAFLTASEALGQISSQSTKTKEVTAEYYDLKARINNKLAEEKRLLEHLQKNTGKLDDILKVEREISRVRGEVELFEGRLRVLSDLTSLSTVTLNIKEIKNYVPVKTESPVLTARIGRAWTGSCESLAIVGSNLVLAAVVAGPWFIVMLVPALIGYAVLRRRKRKTQKKSA
jgi:hypothetical protein